MQRQSGRLRRGASRPVLLRRLRDAALSGGGRLRARPSGRPARGQVRQDISRLHRQAPRGLDLGPDIRMGQRARAADHEPRHPGGRLGRGRHDHRAIHRAMRTVPSHSLGHGARRRRRRGGRHQRRAHPAQRLHGDVLVVRNAPRRAALRRRRRRRPGPVRDRHAAARRPPRDSQGAHRRHLRRRQATRPGAQRHRPARARDTAGTATARP